jgi:hypothetical protein
VIVGFRTNTYVSDQVRIVRMEDEEKSDNVSSGYRPSFPSKV